MKKLFIAVIFLIYTPNISAQELTVEIEGSVTFEISAFSITEAGEDYSSEFLSESSLFLSIYQTDELNRSSNSNYKWSAKVYRSDINWDPNLNLQLKRDGNGFSDKNRGNTNLHDGETYQAISLTESHFVRGRGEIRTIPVSFKLDGVSLLMGAQQFETSVVFTIYDDW